APHHPSLARTALRRHPPEVGAGCPNWARPVLCGGCAVMRIPTATSTLRRRCSACSRGASNPCPASPAFLPYAIAHRAQLMQRDLEAEDRCCFDGVLREGVLTIGGDAPGCYRQGAVLGHID